MRTAKFLLVSGIVVAISGQPQLTHAQEPTPQQERSAAYRLDFAINELEDGKKINTRHYSMNLSVNAGNPFPTKELKIGTRVPVEAERGKFEYLDIGTSISAQLRENRGSTSLDVRTDISNFASPDQAKEGGQPLIRQMVISGSTLVVLDKPMLIGTVDDPNSKREFQLEVTATKLK